MTIRTTDNNCGNLKLTDKTHHDNLKIIGNLKVSELVDDKHPNLLIFPQTLGHFKDDIDKSYIFSLDEETLTTYNIMGFVGINNTQLTISSRFNSEDKNDYFLHYMLQKVFAINIFNFDQNKDKENIWDFLLYLFPYCLKKALAQGLYKEYQHNKYNDSNVKGSIDVARHIRVNNPFMGKVAYSTREHSYDNSLTQLIRHTIEYIKSHQFGNGILNADSDTISATNQILYSTNSYNLNNRHSIISQNLKPFHHPYFTEYKMLQKLCLQILKHEKLTYGKEKDKVYGLLFDGAWLWEEYLDTVLRKADFIHPQNKVSGNPIYLFNQKAPRYPDFWKKDLVLDAKYKHLEYKNNEIDRNDMHQIITYMHVLESNMGGFIFPYSENKQFPMGKLNGYGGEVNLYGFKVPRNNDSFLSFKKEIKESEVFLLNQFIDI